MGLFFKTPEEKARILQIKLNKLKNELMILQRTYPLQKRMNPKAAEKTEKRIGVLQAESNKLNAEAKKLAGVIHAKKTPA